MMGRAERALLCLLGLCVAIVGILTWQSRGRAGSAGISSATQVGTARARGPRTIAQQSAAAHAPGPAHVTAALVSSARPAPVRDLAAIRRKVAGSTSATYIDFMLLHNDSLLVRWPDRYNSPVKVWIQPAANLPEWSVDVVSIAQRAFNAWGSIFLPVRFEFTNDSSAAEIVFTWREPFEGSQVGATRRFRDQHGWVGRAEISMALSTSAGKTIDHKYLSAVAIHEIGHALGLDHSPSDADIMSPGTGTVFLPTQADVQTLALIYSVPPGPVK